MSSCAEFRIPEEKALLYLPHDVGTRLGETVRKVRVKLDDPLYATVERIQRELVARDDFLFLGWKLEFPPDERDLDSEDALRLEVTAVFEPEGEALGTAYDETGACPVCGSGRRQVGPLRLDLGRIPKSANIARTIADEYVVDQRLAELLIAGGVSGMELRPVVDVKAVLDEPLALDRTVAGRTLLEHARASGIESGSWQFFVWLNGDDQIPLLEEARVEQAARSAARHRRRKQMPWYQLILTAHAVGLTPQTRFGIDPFDDDEAGLYRCAFGHVSGLNLLSEAYLRRPDWDGSDILPSRDLVGVRRGALVPSALIFISQRVLKILRKYDIRGWRVDRAVWSDS